MAHVKMLDGREFEIPDEDDAACAYYIGEGATVTKTLTGAGPSSFPAVFDGEKYVDAAPVEELPEGEYVQADSAERTWTPDLTGSALPALDTTPGVPDGEHGDRGESTHEDDQP